VDWYNNEPCHSWICFVTRSQHHRGANKKLLQKRKPVYKQAKARNPLRWSGRVRNWQHRLVFHSDRGYQYTSKRFGKLLKGYDIRPSMGDVGACWDNAVVERFFGRLKHDWILKVISSNDYMSAVKFPIFQINKSCLG